MKTKKELKAQYKEQKPIAGIFQIKNIENGKVLIDDSLNVESKWNRHRSELRFGSHRNKKLQDDWNKSKEENFDFSIISKLHLQEDDNPSEEIKTLMALVEDEIDIPSDRRY